MKIAERYFFDDGRIIQRDTWDPNPTLKRAREIRDGRPIIEIPDGGAHVASVPRHLFEKWLIEDGIRMDDEEAVDEMLARRLNSNEYSHFRTRFQGTF